MLLFGFCAIFPRCATRTYFLLYFFGLYGRYPFLHDAPARLASDSPFFFLRTASLPFAFRFLYGCKKGASIANAKGRRFSMLTQKSHRNFVHCSLREMRRCMVRSTLRKKDSHTSCTCKGSIISGYVIRIRIVAPMHIALTNAQTRPSLGFPRHRKCPFPPV